MIGELDFYGVFLPPLLAWGAIALAGTLLLRRLLDWCGFYRLVWHRPLVDLSLFVILLAGVSAIIPNWIMS